VCGKDDKNIQRHWNWIYVDFLVCYTESILPGRPVDYYTNLYDQLAISYVIIVGNYVWGVA